MITRQQQECSPVGADGRTDGEEVHGLFFHLQISFSDLEHLTRVAIGWDIEDRYLEQVRFSGKI